MKTYNVGILTAGGIAHAMAKTLQNVPNARAYAVAARDLGRAEEFRDKYGMEKAYGSYEELAQDENIDMIYVASPHSHHYEHAKLCLEHGKPVLCEKAFTANAKQARELMEISREKGVFITEAIWPRYMPMAQKLRDILAEGAIGKPNMVVADLGFTLANVPRMAEPALAGGALLDLGVYPINFACIAFGSEWESYTGTAQLTEKGVDAMNNITVRFADGRMAVLYSNMLARTPQMGYVYGSEGHIAVDSVNNLKTIQVFDLNGNETARYERSEGTGYEYEVISSLKAIAAGEIECPEMPHAETLRIMECMDDLRAQWGVRYPFE